MPDLALAESASGRPRLQVPLVRAVNVFTEDTPGGPTQTVRSSRPGLTKLYNLGSGPVLRMAQFPGAFANSYFTISGGQLYQNTSLLGSVAYSQFPRMAGAGNQLAVVSGGALSVYQNGALTPVRFFSDGATPLPPFSSVAVLYNIFVYTVQGTNQFYYSNPGDATTINALNFSSANTNPTPIVDVAVLGEELYFFKALSTEIWDFNSAQTGASTSSLSAFVLSQGRTYVKGCSCQGSVAQSADELYWIGDDLTVYKTGPKPVRVSTPLIEDLLQQGTTNSSNVIFTYSIEGHDWLVMTIGALNQTWAYDSRDPGRWYQWGAQTGNNEEPGPWLGQSSTGYGNGILVGSSTDGSIYLLDLTNRTDNGAAIRSVVSGVLYIPEGVLRVANVSLHCIRGMTGATVQMRFSKNGGRTWTPWLPKTLSPKIGSYGYRATWRGLGIFRNPGINMEFCVADPVNVSMSGASYNSTRV